MDAPLAKDRSRLAGERGAVTTMVVFPLAVFAFLLCAHAALVFHGRSVVAAAAADGLRAAQIENGTASDARAAASSILDLAPGLSGRSVVVSASGDTVTVKVSAELNTVVPGLFSAAGAEVSGPKERFYTEDERP